MTFNRLARFTVPHSLFSSHREELRKFLGRFLVLHTEVDWCRDGRSYIVTADDLPTVKENDQPPRFELIVQYTGPAVEFMLSPEPNSKTPPCPNCERLKKALKAKDWVAVIDGFHALNA